MNKAQNKLFFLRYYLYSRRLGALKNIILYDNYYIIFWTLSHNDIIVYLYTFYIGSFCPVGESVLWRYRCNPCKIIVFFSSYLTWTYSYNCHFYYGMTKRATPLVLSVIFESFIIISNWEKKHIPLTLSRFLLEYYYIN